MLITANHHKAIYKEDGIMNGSRGYIDHIQTNSENPDEVEIIWIVFNNPDTGAKYRADHYKLRGSQDYLHKKATPILIDLI